MSKLITVNDFKNSVKNQKNFVVSGFRWSGTPQLLLRSIREIFNSSGQPNGIKIIFTSSATDPGIDHLAHPDLLSCSYGSYYGSIPEVRKLVEKNMIRGYSLPQGQISLLFQEIARGSPGLISRVGMNTYVDPRNGGGRLNEKTKKNAVERIKIDNKDYLLYKSFSIDIGLLRGSIADRDGNISMNDEPLRTEFLTMAQAVRSCGGKIFVQVASLTDKSIQPSRIDLPSHLVDGVVIADDIEQDHRHTNKFIKNNELINNTRCEKIIDSNSDPDYKKIIGLKALSYIDPESNIILGQGIPELVGVFARKDHLKYNKMLTFMESGVIGGIPERRPDFGVAFGPRAFLSQDHQFVGFNGGHIDIAILSFVEFDVHGNINVSRLGDDYYGCGGYIDICHGAKTLIFVGSLLAKNLKVEKLKDRVNIKSEGAIKKAVKKVKEVTFSSEMHNETGSRILIITERCVFEVLNQKVVLIEAYPGIDIKSEIINNMEFTPEIKIN